MKLNELTDGSGYGVIYADPPWDYKGQKQHCGSKNGKGTDSGGAIEHYPTMSLKDIGALEVSTIADKDCILFMWTSSPHMAFAMDIIKEWGFIYKTVGFVWDKQKVNPGFYTMSQCELCLIATRRGGKIPQPRGARNIRQFLSVMRGKHSEKPAEVRKRIEKMFPNHKRLEMFARTASEGWDVWGNEV